MVRLLYYSVFVLLMLTQSAFAQTPIGVRVGEHDDYSRLVFDWDTPVNYAVQSNAGELIIKFESSAALKSTPPATSTANHISGFNVLSTDPLSVSVSFPAGAKARDFKAGNRVVVDVYALPGAKKVAKAEPKAAPAPAPQPAPPAKVKPEPEEEITSPAQDTASEVPEDAKPSEAQAPDQADLAEVDLGPVVTSTTEDEEATVEEEPAPPQPIAERAKSKIEPTVISLSSSESQGLAVFEMNGDVWIVNDKEDLLLSPQVSGPKEPTITKLESEEIVGGKAFKTKILKDEVTARGQGGGLVWRVIMSADAHETDPIDPLRKDVEEGRERSGKVIWPFKEISKILELVNPVSGVPVRIITVKDAKQFSGPAHDFIDFKTLPSPVGLAIVPKVDDLNVAITDEGIEISRPGGLALQSQSRIAAALERKEREEAQAAKLTEVSDPNKRRVFHFKNWDVGGVSALTPNANIMLADLPTMNDNEKIEALVTLGKMYLANAQGSEALGFLNFAEDLLPGLSQNPEFIALRGASQALTLKSEEAFENLSAEILKPFEEIGYWRSFILADLGDWEQAKEVLPADFSALNDYTPLIFNRLALVLAEVELRSGSVDRAESLLFKIENNKDSLFSEQEAALAYLKGEAARQRGKVDETKKLWEPLTTGKDDLYRAKAGLALTRLLVTEGKLTSKQAIDRLERLRYAWRGDELEAQIYYWLGKTYFEGSDYVRGLNILREAASVAANTDLGARIAADMKDEFSSVFLTDKLDTVSPLDAAALYEQFAELVPIGPEGDKVVEELAEHMVQADLLDRAASLLAHQVDHRLQGAEAHRIGVRLAAIYLLDGRPQEAMAALGRATADLKSLPEELQTPDKFLKISLLRARALSQQKRPDQAIALLEDLGKTPTINRLRADIAWNAGYWDDAAEALEDVILDENISLTRPLDDEYTALILNRAVALNLSSDRVALANMREKYSDAMAQTEKARAFEVVTRPRQSAALANRETLMGIVSEVDLFADFMNNYRSAGGAPADDQAAVATPAEASAETPEAATPPPGEQSQSSESATQ